MQQIENKQSRQSEEKNKNGGVVLHDIKRKKIKMEEFTTIYQDEH